jgi:hypothetical protein
MNLHVGKIQELECPPFGPCKRVGSEKQCLLVQQTLPGKRRAAAKRGEILRREPKKLIFMTVVRKSGERFQRSEYCSSVWLGIQESQPHRFPPVQSTKRTVLVHSLPLSMHWVVDSHCCSFQELDNCTSPFFPYPPRCFPFSFSFVVIVERTTLVVVSTCHFFRKRCLWKHSYSAGVCLWALFGTRIRETGIL